MTPICDQHGTTPNPLCHVQQARQPSNDELRTRGYDGPDGRDQYERDAQYFGYGDKNRAEGFRLLCDMIVAGCAVAFVLWFLLSVWLVR